MSLLRVTLAVVSIVAILGSMAGLGYAIILLKQSNIALSNYADTLEISLRQKEIREKRALAYSYDLTVALQQEQATNNNLSQNLLNELAKNTLFESQIQAISSQVGTLQKLSETDKELLKKYSKVYFLSENYVPSSLTSIPAQYLLTSTTPERIHTNVAPFLERMMWDAREASSTLLIASAYRSFDEQKAVKTGYKTLYGSGANSFSADQGYSEHQLGTTVDLTTPKLKRLVTTFEKDPAFIWLENNAHRYGYTLSYPKNNGFYQFEPWHWRFVGVALATKLHNDSKHFYDLTQREIDAFLISIFDNQ